MIVDGRPSTRLPLPGTQYRGQKQVCEPWRCSGLYACFCPLQAGGVDCKHVKLAAGRLLTVSLTCLLEEGVSFSLNKAPQKMQMKKSRDQISNESIRSVGVHLVNHLQGWGQGGTKIRQRRAGKRKEQDNIK